MKRAAAIASKPLVTVTWTRERDDRRLLRVTEILLEIMREPVDSEPAPDKREKR